MPIRWLFSPRWFARIDLVHPMFVLRRPGGYVEVSEPDPIPNSVVKRLRANGTMSQDLGE